MAAVEHGRQDKEHHADRHEHDRTATRDKRSDREGKHKGCEAETPEKRGSIGGGIDMR
jgi:hypothetical protein